jgi:hypothetical protein
MPQGDEKSRSICNYAGRHLTTSDDCAPGIEPLPQDKRFAGEHSRASCSPILKTGGHNVGIGIQPGRADRSCRVITKRHRNAYVDPEARVGQSAADEGSWWSEWVGWLDARSGAPVSPPWIGIAVNQPWAMPWEPTRCKATGPLLELGKAPEHSLGRSPEFLRMWNRQTIALQSQGLPCRLTSEMNPISPTSA